MDSSLEQIFSASSEELDAMLLSLVGMPKAEVEAELNAIKQRIEEVAATVPYKGEKGDKGDKGDVGPQGPRGLDGKQGRDGYQGKDGKAGVDGKDGLDGKDGISIVDAKVEFDGHLVIYLSDGTEIDAGQVTSQNENVQNLVANYISNSVSGSLVYKGVWNASTNTPTLSLSSSDAGHYYIVGVAGTTNLSGITDWQVNDWAVFNGTAWQKVDNSDLFDATNVAITGGSINNTSIGATTASTGRFTSVTTPSVTATTNDLTLSSVGTNNINFNSGNGIQFKVNNTYGAGGTSVNYFSTYGRQSGSSPIFAAEGTDSTLSPIFAAKAGNFLFRTADITGSNQFVISHTASAVNYVQVTGSATGIGNFPTISSQGSDANVNLRLSAKGSANIDMQIGGTTRTSIDSSGTFRAGIAANGTAGFQVSVTGSQVNYLSTTGTITNQEPTIIAAGSDTNISLGLQSKGTGAIDIAAGSSGVNISNGTTVTAITRTNAGSAYTSFPSIAISAPTTAGGVQAVANVAQMFANTATIQAGGTGYTVGNTVTLVGGTPASGAATYTISAVSGGVVTAVTPLSFGAYTVLPTNPVSVTGGSGTGLTLNVTYGVQNFTISNAGSGYIEQPTVTFSGGGGSGAAAYASVGSSTTIRHLTAFHSFTGPSGISFAVNSASGTVANYVQAGSQSASNFPSLAAQGSDTNIGLDLFSKGTSPVRARTGTGGAEQFRISDTASAVNYVQVTGAATTGIPVISAQGSDTNINLNLQAKGSGQVRSVGWMSVGVGAANYWQLASAGAGSSPVLSVVGSDTNIDLALTPKGTGVVQFGTYTATVTAVAGFIQIRDAGGTLRKLAVLA